jgi:hypothetical protein
MPAQNKRYRFIPVKPPEFRLRLTRELNKWADKYSHEDAAYREAVKRGLPLPSVRPEIAIDGTVRNWLEGTFAPSKDAVDRMEELGFPIIQCMYDVREV